MLNFLSEIWSIIKEFWVSLTVLIFWKIISDSLPKDLSIQTIYKKTKQAVIYSIQYVQLFIILVVFQRISKSVANTQKEAQIYFATLVIVLVGVMAYVHFKNKEKQAITT
tara:strand:- start:573 stop:902 length:330 start_codon:yes stop_codon:yes gene_type:complete